MTTHLEGRIALWSGMVAKRVDEGNADGATTCLNYLIDTIEAFEEFKSTGDEEKAFAWMDAQVESVKLETQLWKRS